MPIINPGPRAKYNQIITIKNVEPIDFDSLQTLENQYSTLTTEYETATTNYNTYTTQLETYQATVTTKTTEKATLVSTIAKIDIGSIVVDNGPEWPQGTPPSSIAVLRTSH